MNSDTCSGLVTLESPPPVTFRWPSLDPPSPSTRSPVAAVSFGSSPGNDSTQTLHRRGRRVRKGQTILIKSKTEDCPESSGPPLGFRIPDVEISKGSLRTIGEAVGTGVLCGPTALFGFNTPPLPEGLLQGQGVSRTAMQRLHSLQGRMPSCGTIGSLVRAQAGGSPFRERDLRGQGLGWDPFPTTGSPAGGRVRVRRGMASTPKAVELDKGRHAQYIASG